METADHNCPHLDFIVDTRHHGKVARFTGIIDSIAYTCVTGVAGIQLVSCHRTQLAQHG